MADKKASPEPVTVQLRQPVTMGSDTITSLTFRPCKMKDLRRLKSDMGLQATIELAGYLSGQTTQVIDELGDEDAGEVLRIVNSFTARLLGTGTVEPQS